MWFLHPEAYHKLRQFAAVDISAVAQEKIEIRSKDLGKLIKNGSTGIIPIAGVLTNKFDYFAAYLLGGNTLYPDIVDSINQANSDQEIKDIELRVGYSPGGDFTGLIGAMQSISGSTKRITARVSEGAHSAAYGLVSQAGEIVAKDEGASFGSVGVAFDTWVSTAQVSIASTDAPKKRPDLTTEEGKAIVREELDEYHELFASLIAKGRGTNLKGVNKNFGKGGSMLAKKALAAGMIDRIGFEQDQSTNTNEENATMNLKELQLSHPELFEQVVQIGVKGERDRVCAHLELGLQSGDMTTAKEAIESGALLSATLQAKYLSATINRQAADARKGDNPDVGKTVDNTVDEFDLAVARELDQRFGAVQ